MSKQDLIRSSVAEYLTFITATGESQVEAIYADENVWLSQKMMAVLYDVDVRTISYHLKKIFNDNELAENSVVQFFWITAQDGKNYQTKHYNLSAIIAVGYKVNSERAVQFRKWATEIVQSFAIKGFAMDDERLKNDGTILGKNTLKNSLPVFGKFDYPNASSTKKSPTFMQPQWTMTVPLLPPNAFLPQYKTNSTGQFTAYRS